LYLSTSFKQCLFCCCDFSFKGLSAAPNYYAVIAMFGFAPYFPSPANYAA
jgi:hypothetical protein